MTNPYRAICAELLNGLDELADPRYPFPGYTRCTMDRARALLAQPVAEGPTNEELLELWLDGWNTSEEGSFRFARAVLARWGHPTPQPVAQEEDCPGCEGTPVASNSPCAVCGRAVLAKWGHQ